MTCTSPCTISGLDPGTEYQFTVIPNNNCGSPTGCTGNATTLVQAGEHQVTSSFVETLVIACNCIIVSWQKYKFSYTYLVI